MSPPASFGAGLVVLTSTVALTLTASAVTICWIASLISSRTVLTSPAGTPQFMPRRTSRLVSSSAMKTWVCMLASPVMCLVAVGMRLATTAAFSAAVRVSAMVV